MYWMTLVEMIPQMHLQMSGVNSCSPSVLGCEHGGGRGPGECFLGPQLHQGGGVWEVRGVHRSGPPCQVRLRQSGREYAAEESGAEALAGPQWCEYSVKHHHTQ